jgi:Calcineurin-like phosphoesterase/Putative Ig domain
MATEPRRMQVRLLCSVLVVVAVAATVVAASVQTAGAAGPAPIAVTPFAGFNASLTRAPYVTDLTQTGADVNWATTVSSPGTLQWGPLGSCTAHTATVPPALPNSYPAAGTPTSITNPEFNVVSGTNEYQSTVVLTGLSPSTTYCYRPLGPGSVDLLGSNPTQQFTTLDPAASSNPLTFDVVGDIGETLYSSTTAFPNNLNTDQAAVDSLIGSSGAKFVVTAGDVGYSGGTQANYGDLQNGGSEISDIFGPSYWPQTKGLPVFPGEGNHGQNTIGLRSWPEANTAAASPGGTYAYDSYPAPTQDGTNPGSYPDGWYAFSDAGVRIYVLDAAWADGSNVGSATGAACTSAGEAACPGYQVDHDEHWTPSSPEYKWLAADLASHPGSVKLAVWHYPLRSDESSQDSDVYLQNSPSNPYQSSSLESLLSANGVKVAFNGHAHNYERIAPSAAGQITNYVTGGGGGVLEPVSTGSSCTGFKGSGSIYAIGWSPTSNTGTACGTGVPAPQSAAQVFNFLKVTVNGGTVTVTPTNAAGQTFDVQSYSYSTTPATVIDTPPPALTNSTSASVSFHSTGSGATFTCSLDHATASACTSPVSYTGLAQGAHTLTVAASGGATPATANWTVETSPPSVPTILTGSAASATQVNLTWSTSSDPIGVSGYDVYRNGVLLTTSPVTTTSYTDSTASPGTTYQYTVDARDGAGNVSNQSTAFPVTTPAGSVGPALVQTAGSTTTTVSLPVPSTPGDLLVLSAGVFTGASHPITAVSDGKNTWTKVGAYDVAGSNSDGEMWYSANAASVSSVTVTTGASTVALRLQEFNGVAATTPLDGSNGAAGDSTVSNSGTATALGANDLAVGFVAGHSTSQAISITSAGYAAQPLEVATSPSTVTVESAYRDLAAPGSQSLAGSFGTTMYWASGIALFKAGTPPPPPGDFTVGATPTGQTVTAGASASSTIGTTAVGTPQLVALSATGLPTGSLVSFAPQSITSGGSSVMGITTSSTTPPGTYTVTVTATGTSAVHTTTFALTVDTPPAITSAASTTFTAGSSGTFSVTTTGSPTAALSESGALPSGVNFVDNGNGTATLSGTPASGSAASYAITITATNGIGTPASQSFTLTVNAPASNDFSVAASPTSATVTAGSPTSPTISTAVTSGATQSVALSATGAPSGALVSFNPQTINAGQSSTMTVTTSSTTPTGTYPITVTGTGSTATHTVTFSLTVNPVSTSVPALVQTASATESATSTSLSGSFPSATTAGHLLVLSVSEYTGATNHVTSVTDSAGNTWTRVGAYDVSGHNSNGELWYAANATTVTTVTVHVAAAASMAFEVQEFSGVATAGPLDVSAGTSNTGTTASSGTAASSVANELVVGFIAGHNNAQAISVTSPGYVNQAQQTTTAGTIASIVTGYQVVGTPGSQSYAGGFGTAMYWAAGIAVFKP